MIFTKSKKFGSSYGPLQSPRQTPASALGPFFEEKTRRRRRGPILPAECGLALPPPTENWGHFLGTRGRPCPSRSSLPHGRGPSLGPPLRSMGPPEHTYSLLSHLSTSPAGPLEACGFTQQALPRLSQPLEPWAATQRTLRLWPVQALGADHWEAFSSP